VFVSLLSCQVSSEPFPVSQPEDIYSSLDLLDFRPDLNMRFSFTVSSLIWPSCLDDFACQVEYSSYGDGKEEGDLVEGLETHWLGSEKGGVRKA
jgi:hypothetical protein